MMSSTLISQLLQYGNSIHGWKIFAFVSIAVSISILFIILKHAFHRRGYSKLVPGKRLQFFSILGHLSDIPLTLKGRNGLSLSAKFLQILTEHTEMFRKHKLFLLWISYVPYVCLVKAEAVEAFISGTKNNEKSWQYNMLHPWLGEGLLTSHGKKWKTRRKLITPAFHFEILKDFLPVMNEQSQVLVKCLKTEIDKEFTNIIPWLSYCSLDIICKTTLGVSVGAQENNDSQYVKSVKRLSEITMERMINCLNWSDFIFSRTKAGKEFNYHLNLVHKFTRAVIQEKKEKLLKGDSGNGKGKRKALLDLLLEHHINTQDLTEEDIREEVDTFTFAGHDTTSMGMSWALYLIGLDKNVQKKIQEELDSIFGTDVLREITTEDLNEMKYLECVLKESQRLYPTLPLLGRNVSEDTEICGYKLIKGATCVVLIYQLHRDEDVFPQAEKFDPERFLPENSINRHHYAYIPFSAGPRNCLGQRFAIMEEKVIVANILRNYSIDSLDEREQMQPAADLMLKPSVPIRIQIRPRL